MRKTTILYRLFQLLIILTLLVIFLSTVIFYIYAFLFYSKYDDLLPDLSDYLITLISTLASIFLAFFFALIFTKRLSPPISSIASAARAIAEGNLIARAQAGDYKLLELDNLVRDFNLMAEKLEIMSKNMQIWNATVAHELRTPVTILRGNLQAVLDGVITSDTEHTLLLLKQTDNLASIIDDLRIVSLADTGQFKLYREHIAIDELLSDIYRYMKSEFKHHNKILNLVVEQSIGYVDELRLKQAIMALLHNALQYSVEGIVSFGCRVIDEELIITVEDEGPGIPEGYRKKIFEPFYRINEFQFVARSSSGLGLSVVKAIADAHGGKVRCSENSMGGAAFSIVLSMNYN